MKGIDIARTMLGLDESHDKDKIMAFLKANAIKGDIDIDPSKISWCAAFMNGTLRASKEGEGTGALNAQSFLKYGTEIENWDDAQEGDIVVFHFPSDLVWQGHVTYFVKWNDDANTVVCLGGNQKNGITENNYSQDYIKAIRRA